MKAELDAALAEKEKAIKDMEQKMEAERKAEKEK